MTRTSRKPAAHAAPPGRRIYGSKGVLVFLRLEYGFVVRSRTTLLEYRKSTDPLPCRQEVIAGKLRLVCDESDLRAWCQRNGIVELPGAQLG